MGGGEVPRNRYPHPPHFAKLRVDGASAACVHGTTPTTFRKPMTEAKPRNPARAQRGTRQYAGMEAHVLEIHRAQRTGLTERVLS